MTSITTRLARLEAAIGQPPREGRVWYVLGFEPGKGDRRVSPCGEPAHPESCYRSVHTGRHCQSSGALREGGAYSFNFQVGEERSI